MLFAVALPVVVGGFGFGTEMGSWYFQQRKLQNAADIAAYAAATELRAGRSLARIEAAAEAAAAETGFDAGRGALDVVTPVDGRANDVAVTVVERIPRSFSGLWRDGAVELGGRAVARVSEGLPSCVLALDPMAARAVTFSGNTETIFVGCNVHANSLASDAIYIQGSPTVEVDCISASGGVSIADSDLLTLTNCVAPYEHADVVADPYADLPAPSASGGCRSDAGATLLPGRYCAEMRLNGAVTLQPGVYVLERGVRINANAVVNGTGVTLYIKGSYEARFNGGAEIRLAAPTAGPYAGVLLYADRTAGSGTSHVINGNANSFFEGAIYAPSGNVDYLGNNQTNGGCSPVVARTVTFSGNASVGIDCTSVMTADIRSSRLISLVE